MRMGKITQTMWKRSVKKQLHVDKSGKCSTPEWEENCSAMELDEEQKQQVVWRGAVVGDGTEKAGFYAAIKAAGDLAAKGIRPSALSVQILFRAEAEENDLKNLTMELKKTCEELHLEFAGFQAESVPFVKKTVVYVTVTGYGKEKTETDLQAGNEILLCGYAGLEGTLRILDEAENELSHRFISTFLEKTKKLKEKLTRPEQILEVAAEETPGLAVCQIGSGGILAALWELAEMEKIGFEVDFSKIALKQETVEICEFYQLNPYLMTSAGSFLIVTDRGEETIELLRRCGADVTRIGIVKDQNARELTGGEEVRYLDRPAPDELMKWWEKRC